MTNRRTSSVFCILAALLAGCTAASPLRYYTLSSTVAPAAAPTDCIVAVGPILVPAVVDRLPIVLRTGPNQVVFDEFNRWASPLKGEISRVVAENLAALLGTPHVTIFPQSAVPDAAYRIVIDVRRFESEPGKAVILDALWTVSSGKTGQSHSGRITITELTRSGNFTDLAAAHSRAIGGMCAEIALTIRNMEEQKNKNSFSWHYHGFRGNTEE